LCPALQTQPRDGQTQGEADPKVPDASESLWRDGFLHSGDIGRMDADGRLQSVGKLDKKTFRRLYSGEA
jgi:hypothetical protein